MRKAREPVPTPTPEPQVSPDVKALVQAQAQAAAAQERAIEKLMIDKSKDLARAAGWEGELIVDIERDSERYMKRLIIRRGVTH